MIGYLEGKVNTVRLNYLYLDTKGVGYKIFFPVGQKDTFEKGKEIKLYIYEIIREDRFDLYGFLKIEELDIFEKLISVNGVGPKAGIAILSTNNYEDIINAISGENVSFFTSIPGIGRKVASKIILEVRPKITGMDSNNVVEMTKDANDLIDAMKALGYHKQDINKVIGKIPKDLKETQEKIRWMLKNI